MRICPGIGKSASDIRLGLAMGTMNKIEPVKLIERDRVATCEAMVLRHREDIFPAEQPIKLYAALRLRHNGNGKVNTPVPKPALKLGDASVLDRDLDIRMRLAEITDQCSKSLR